MIEMYFKKFSSHPKKDYVRCFSSNSGAKQLGFLNEKDD